MVRKAHLRKQILLGLYMKWVKILRKKVGRILKEVCFFP